MSNEGSKFSIEITMTDGTVTQLSNNGFNLFAFKGVDGPDFPAARPLVWFKTQDYSADTTVSWTEKYGGYVSTTTNVAAGTVIDARNAKPMILGQQMNVADKGVLTVVNAGDKGLLDVLSQTTAEFTCGITVVNPAKAFAFPAPPASSAQP